MKSGLRSEVLSQKLYMTIAELVIHDLRACEKKKPFINISK